MTMPITVQQRDQAWANRQPDGWDSWAPEVLEPRPALWRYQPWHQRVDTAAVDQTRTAALRAHKHASAVIKCSTGLSEGRYSGVPWQHIAGPETTRVYEAKVVPFAKGYGPIPYSYVRLPEVVRRVGDPAGGGDLQFLGIEAGQLVEMSACGPSGWPISNLCPWRCERVHRWDLTKPWAPQKTKGMIAGGMPMLPMIPTFEQFATGEIAQAFHFVAPNYDRTFIAPARGSDGTWTGHPLRGGTRLRLRPSVLLRILESATHTIHDRVAATGLNRVGAIVDDQTGLDGRDGKVPRGNIRTPQDPRIHLTLEFRLDDFEIVTPT